MDISTSKKILVVTGSLFAVVFIHALVVRSTPHIPEEHMPALSLPREGPIVIEGTMLCLPHRETGGVQTLECAYGLEDKEGRYFALSDTDMNYRNLISAPMGTPVTVTGTFGPHASSHYQDIGIISVTNIAEVSHL